MAMPAHMHDTQERGSLGTLRPRTRARSHDAPIDWAHLSRFTMNDKALEREVLGLFAAEAPRYLARLQGATNRKDWIEAAHTLKGSARAVGAWAIAECAQAAEALQLSAQREFAAATSGGEADASATHGARQSLERLHEAVRGTLSYIEQLAPLEADGVVSRPL
jgi:HPt (histidine-containing phosphotransfer) domain-containing protein